MKKSSTILKSLIRLITMVILTYLYINAFSQTGTIRDNWNTQADTYRDGKVTGSILITRRAEPFSSGYRISISILILVENGSRFSIGIKPGATSCRGS